MMEQFFYFLEYLKILVAYVMLFGILGSILLIFISIPIILFMILKKNNFNIKKTIKYLLEP